jgi:hypothetical protein
LIHRLFRHINGILSILRESQQKEHKMTQEDWDEIEELEDARENPRKYGLDQDGWPNAEQFNAMVREVAGLGIDDE